MAVPPSAGSPTAAGSGRPALLPLQAVSPKSASRPKAPTAIILVHPFTRSSCPVSAFLLCCVHPTLSAPNFQILDIAPFLRYKMASEEGEHTRSLDEHDPLISQWYSLREVVSVSKKLSLSVSGFLVFWPAFSRPACQNKKAAGPDKIQPRVPIAVRPFPLQNVRLLDGPFKQAMDRNTRYLHDLDSDPLLHNFRLAAGLSTSALPLGGWEEPKLELRGHFVGHFLTACALTYAATGDEALRRKADALVAELAKCQKALDKTGYLSAFPEEFIDRVIEGKRVWAPWYTLHKIMAGLLDMHVHCGNKKALNVVKGMAAWSKLRIDKLDDDAMQRMLKVEHGGMTEVLANLYAVTGDPGHLALARRVDPRALLNPLAER